MSENSYELELPGCTPEPLMAYLKALGILRLVSEQVDPDTRGWWMNDTFWLRSPALFGDTYGENLKRETLVNFFLDRYKPTPIVAPWGARSGFYAGSSEKSARAAIQAIEQSPDARLQQFVELIGTVRRILENLDLLHKAESDDAKLSVMRACRAGLPDEALGWIDACYVLTSDRRRFPPLLGTGGNEGSGSYVSGFAQAVVDCLIKRAHDRQLDLALFPRAFKGTCEAQTPGHFSPSSSGGANATQGFEGAVQTNLWEYILCLEGCCVWCSGPSKRFASTSRGNAGYPFTFEAVGSGAPSLTDADGRKPKNAKRDIAEIWLPLWDRPLALTELQTVLIEGRAEHGTRQASSGLDMARAVAALGVDNGIASFSRHMFQMRNGQSFMAIPLGRFPVQARASIELLRETDPWMDRFRRAAGNEKAPPRFGRALRAINSAIFDFCRYGGRPLFQRILIALGRAERELARTPGRVGQSKWPPGPLIGLSRNWLEAADDQSAEFVIARALAGVHDPQRKIGSLRANLEPVAVWRNHDGYLQGKWAERDRAVVWNADHLPSNLAAVLARRLMDSARRGCESMPLTSRVHASLNTIAKFIGGQTDDRRIEELLWGLVFVDPSAHRPGDSEVAPEFPAVYALLKLLFLPQPLVIKRRDDGRVSVRCAKPHENGFRIRPEPRIPHLLRAGRLGEACVIAVRRLRASGLPPMPRARAGQTREGDWRELDRMGDAGIDPLRLAAALLIPISDAAISRLVTLVTWPEEIETGPEPLLAL